PRAAVLLRPRRRRPPFRGQLLHPPLIRAKAVDATARYFFLRPLGVWPARLQSAVRGALEKRLHLLAKSCFFGCITKVHDFAPIRASGEPYSNAHVKVLPHRLAASRSGLLSSFPRNVDESRSAPARAKVRLVHPNRRRRCPHRNVPRRTAARVQLSAYGGGDSRAARLLLATHPHAVQQRPLRGKRSPRRDLDDSHFTGGGHNPHPFSRRGPARVHLHRALRPDGGRSRSDKRRPH